MSTTDELLLIAHRIRSSAMSDAARDQADEVIERLDGPLRVAIAGKVKAGKSTLLNALVGSQLAPTDAGECTKVVTWYLDGATYRVTAETLDGDHDTLRFSRNDGALDIDLGPHVPESLARLRVEWPSEALRELVLIDTPGIDSVNTEISRRTEDFVGPDDGACETDAVVYLMRHLHQSDVRFLESFHDRAVAHPSPINTIGVLSRADEVGVGRLDAMRSAAKIAARYSADPKVRSLCQSVLPVAGLLAETAVTLRHEEFQQLQTLSELPRPELDELLLSVDRFVAERSAIRIAPGARERLLQRFGMFGIRLGIATFRQQRAPSPGPLADLLADKSGLSSLRETLRETFGVRGELLRARSAMLRLDQVLSGEDSNEARAVGRDLERLHASMHEFNELALFSALRAGHVDLPDPDRPVAERLLGASGFRPHERLGLDRGSSAEEIRTEASVLLLRWQRLAENPLRARSAHAARVLARTCEGLIAATLTPMR